MNSLNKNDRMTMMAELPVHEVLLKMSLPKTRFVKGELRLSKNIIRKTIL